MVGFRKYLFYIYKFNLYVFICKLYYIVIRSDIWFWFDYLVYCLVVL